MGAGAAPVAPTASAAPATYVPKAGIAMQNAPDIPEFMKAQHADLVYEANKSLADRMAERKAMYAAEGVADVSEGQRLQRAEMMAEKSNMGEERQRQINLRLAEFFAEWGSTPGPTLVAGMNALKKAIPNFVADEKEQKKLRREIDKSIADLDNSMRLEKRGDIDAADAKRQKSADNLKDAYGKFVEYDSKRKSDKSTADSAAAGDRSRSESAKFVAGKQYDATVEAARLRNISDRATGDAANRRADEATRYNFQRQALGAKQASEKLEVDIAKEAKDTQEYTRAKTMASVTKIAPADRVKVEKIVKDYEKGWNDRRKTAKEDLDLANAQLKEMNERLGYGKKPNSSGGGGATSNRPPLNDPSLQKQ